MNRYSGLPLYKQIVNDLETNIAAHHSPGDRLPTEAQLADSYDVNRLTVRSALAELARRGLVETVRGKGTFVASPFLRYDISAGRDASFTTALTERGHRVQTRLLKVQFDDDAEIRAQLGSRAPLRRTDILRLVDAQAWSLTSTWMVPERFPGLEDRWVGDTSLHQVLLERYGVRMKRATRSFAAIAADAVDAEWLLIPVASPILQVRGLNVDEDARPIAAVEHRFRGDRLQFSLELQ